MPVTPAAGAFPRYVQPHLDDLASRAACARALLSPRVSLRGALACLDVLVTGAAPDVAAEGKALEEAAALRERSRAEGAHAAAALLDSLAVEVAAAVDAAEAGLRRARDWLETANAEDVGGVGEARLTFAGIGSDGRAVVAAAERLVAAMQAAAIRYGVLRKSHIADSHARALARLQRAHARVDKAEARAREMLAVEPELHRIREAVHRASDALDAADAALQPHGRDGGAAGMSDEYLEELLVRCETEVITVSTLIKNEVKPHELRMQKAADRAEKSSAVVTAARPHLLEYIKSRVPAPNPRAGGCATASKLDDAVRVRGGTAEESRFRRRTGAVTSLATPKLAVQAAAGPSPRRIASALKSIRATPLRTSGEEAGSADGARGESSAPAARDDDGATPRPASQEQCSVPAAKPASPPAPPSRSRVSSTETSSGRVDTRPSDDARKHRSPVAVDHAASNGTRAPPGPRARVAPPGATRTPAARPPRNRQRASPSSRRRRDGRTVDVRRLEGYNEALREHRNMLKILTDTQADTDALQSPFATELNLEAHLGAAREALLKSSQLTELIDTQQRQRVALVAAEEVHRRATTPPTQREKRDIRHDRVATRAAATPSRSMSPRSGSPRPKTKEEARAAALAEVARARATPESSPSSARSNVASPAMTPPESHGGAHNATVSAEGAVRPASDASGAVPAPRGLHKGAIPPSHSVELQGAATPRPGERSSPACQCGRPTTAAREYVRGAAALSPSRPAPATPRRRSVAQSPTKLVAGAVKGTTATAFGSTFPQTPKLSPRRFEDQLRDYVNQPAPYLVASASKPRYTRSQRRTGKRRIHSRRASAPSLGDRETLTGSASRARAASKRMGAAPTPTQRTPHVSIEAGAAPNDNISPARAVGDRAVHTSLGALLRHGPVAFAHGDRSTTEELDAAGGADAPEASTRRALHHHRRAAKPSALTPAPVLAPSSPAIRAANPFLVTGESPERRAVGVARRARWAEYDRQRVASLSPPPRSARLRRDGRPASPDTAPSATATGTRAVGAKRAGEARSYSHRVGSSPRRVQREAGTADPERSPTRARSRSLRGRPRVAKLRDVSRARLRQRAVDTVQKSEARRRRRIMEATTINEADDTHEAPSKRRSRGRRRRRRSPHRPLASRPTGPREGGGDVAVPDTQSPSDAAQASSSPSLPSDSNGSDGEVGGTTRPTSRGGSSGADDSNVSASTSAVRAKETEETGAAAASAASTLDGDDGDAPLRARITALRRAQRNRFRSARG